MKLAWLSDLHLDRVPEDRRKVFYRQLGKEDFDAAVITGDISDARHLPAHLRELARACQPRVVYFVLGNHDFFFSSFDEVDRAVAAVCLDEGNLRHLGQGELVPLSGATALIGHRGWADGRAGWGWHSKLRNPDQFAIEDLRNLSKKAFFGKMAELGRASGRYFREVLPYSMKCYEHVIVATHVPPFTSAAFYNGKPCGGHHLPHYTNISAGGAIKAIAGSFLRSRVTVLCGHTHSRAAIEVTENVKAQTGHARPGNPTIQSTFDLN